MKAIAFLSGNKDVTPLPLHAHTGPRCERRVLSLIQPWATLLVAGLKTIETRSWPNPYRGPLLIHASKTWSKSLEVLCAGDHFAECLEELGYAPVHSARQGRPSKTVRDLPRGAILGQVNLYDIQPTHAFFESPLAGRMTDRELAFGDYGVDRYGWLCSHFIRFAEPVYARGAQGVFHLEQEQEQAVREQLARCATSGGR